MPTWLGIDIGGASVKAALVRCAYRKVALARVASVDIPVGVRSPSGRADDVTEGGTVEAVRAAVARVLEGEKQGADAVAVAIEGSRAAIHKLLLPATAQKQLADVLAYELEAQVPFDMESAVFDWRSIETPRDDGQLAMVAAVARVDDVRARVDLVREAIALEPERVGVGGLALSALVPYCAALSDAETVAVVDLGAKASEVLVLERGEPVFARTVSTGTQGLPAAAPRLAREIRTSFAAHRAQGGKAPSRVYLCGGGAFVSGAEGFLSGELEVVVQMLPDPAIDLSSLGEPIQDLPRYSKAVALALSLAGRGAGMNLRRGPLAFERGFAWVRERTPLLAGLAAAILVSFVFSGWSRLHSVHKERDALEKALATVTKEVLGTEATSAAEAQDLLAKEVALTDEDPLPHADAFDVMVRISEVVPQSMKHDIEELDLQKGHVTVRGIVGSIPDAQSIASSLSDERCLANAQIKNTMQVVGSDRQKYLMELDLRCPEDLRTSPKKKGEAPSSASVSPSAAGGK